MRKLLTLALTVALAIAFVTSCSNDNTPNSEAYAEWREQNEAWVNSLASKTNADGTPMYTKVTPGWDPSGYVLMRHIGQVNTGNLVPLYTSTTSVNYQVHLMNDSLIDKGTAFASTLNDQGLIAGWAIAQMHMHVGDSCEIIMPQQVAYGSSGASTVSPYSALRFNMRLVDVVKYETKP